MSSTNNIQGQLGFAKATDVSPDHERKGLLRCKTYPINADPRGTFELQHCPVYDLNDKDAPDLDLHKMGFDCIDLSGNLQLQELLNGVRKDGYLNKKIAAEIRRLLRWKAFQLSNGKRLTLLFISPQGFIIRKSGPNGLSVTADENMTEMNGHDAASLVHGDQDVYGTPIKQMLKGMGPTLFNHQSPDGRNLRSPLFLLNLWIPLQQVVHPLVLMDRRTLNLQSHQIRLGIPTGTFLKRSQKLNDSWTYLYDDKQKWYFNSTLDMRNGYIFDTLGAPHGAVILPGEEIAEKYYLLLQHAIKAVAARNKQKLESIYVPQLPSLPKLITPQLLRAIEVMHTIIQETSDLDLTQNAQANWVKRARLAMDNVVRKSIEMRLVGWVN